jgi:GNAT superfamily N-acetyltransferase
MEIRPAQEADIAALATLTTELGYPTTPEEMQARLKSIDGNGGFACLVALLDGSVAGMIGLAVTPSFARNAPHGEIIALVVGAGNRGRGIGRALVDRGEAWLADKGVERATVNSGTHRDGAHAFYRACGYKPTGFRFARELR